MIRQWTKAVNDAKRSAAGAASYRETTPIPMSAPPPTGSRRELGAVHQVKGNGTRNAESVLQRPDPTSGPFGGGRADRAAEPDPFRGRPASCGRSA